MPSPRDRERRLIDATLAARVAFGGVDCPPAPARRGADLFATVAVILSCALLAAFGIYVLS